MTSGSSWSSCLASLAFCFVISGSFHKTLAASTCYYNGENYIAGQTVTYFSAVCAAIECQLKKGTGSEENVELVITLQDFYSCTCNIGFVYSNDLNSFHNATSEKSVNKRDLRHFDRLVNLPHPDGLGKIPFLSKVYFPHHTGDKRDSLQSMNTLHSSYHSLKQFNVGHLEGRGSREASHESELMSNIMPRRIKRNDGCKFNEEFYEVGQTVYTLRSRCLQLVCVQDNIGSLIRVHYMQSCSCTPETALLSAHGTKFKGTGGKGGRGKGALERQKGLGGLSPGAASVPKCADYSAITPQHSACKPKSQTCIVKREGVTQAEKRAILKAHNEFRAKVAKGLETRGDPGPQPSATNMRELVWNDELAKVAQAWAFTCPNGHDCYDCRQINGRDYLVGQNLYWSWGFSGANEWVNAITSFYDEVQYVPNTLVDKYESINARGDIGHYTQLVWAETYEIGCGAIYFGPCSLNGANFEWCKTYACDYGDAGNFIGRSIYESGPAASNCPGKKSKKYNGLCK